MKLIVVAMHDEIDEYLKNQFTKIEEKPFEIYQNNDIIVLITGVGKVNASSALTYTLTKFKGIKAIVNIGFAGATNPLQVGDFVGVKDSRYHDFDATIFGYEKGQVPKLPAFYVTDNVLLTKVKSKFNLLESNLYTGDYFMSNQDAKDNYLVDMEGAALYHVAYLLKMPIISFKVVSDIISSKDQIENYQQFEEAIGAKLIADNLCKIMEVI